MAKPKKKAPARSNFHQIVMQFCALHAILRTTFTHQRTKFTHMSSQNPPTVENDRYSMGGIVAGTTAAATTYFGGQYVLNKRDYNAAPVPSHLADASAHEKLQAVFNMDEKTSEWLLRDRIQQDTKKVFLDAINNGKSSKDAFKLREKQTPKIVQQAADTLAQEVADLQQHFNDLTEKPFRSNRTFQLDPKGAQRIEDSLETDSSAIIDTAKSATAKLEQTSAEYHNLRDLLASAEKKSKSSSDPRFPKSLLPSQTDKELEAIVLEANEPEATRTLAQKWNALHEAAADYIVHATHHPQENMLTKIIHMDKEKTAEMIEDAQRLNHRGGIMRDVGVSMLAGVAFAVAASAYRDINAQEKPRVRVQSPELLERMPQQQIQR